jgi:hypothetical protein
MECANILSREEPVGGCEAGAGVLDCDTNLTLREGKGNVS